MKKSKCMSAFIAFLLVFLSLFSGCGSKDESENIKSTKEDNPLVSASEKSNEVSSVKDNNTTETVKTTTTESEAKTETKTEKITENNKKSEDVTASDSESFFDGAVFVGDSITLGLRNFVTSERNAGHECLGKAKFLTEGCMGYSNTIRGIGTKDSIHPKYEGREMYIEDALALIKADKVFIMLGMNDFCIYSVKEGIGNAEKCINRIKEKNPGIGIYIESVTPALSDRGSFNNANIDKFNTALKKFCEENGYSYVDVASVMKDSNGALISSYCGDPEVMGIHMTYEGCRVWVDYLNKTYGEEK